MTEIKKLINKYYNPDGKNLTATTRTHKAEHTSNHYKKQQRQQTNHRKRQAILTTLLQETPFYLHPDRVKQIRYWITTFNKDFKNFHRQASDETIILALIFIQRKQANKRTRLEEYSITTKYNLTTPIFTNIQNQLIFELMKTTPLQYNQKITLYNHIEQNKP